MSLPNGIVGAPAQSLAAQGCNGVGELAKTRRSLFRADYQDGGDDGDVDDNNEDYNDGKADDARKCIGRNLQKRPCATTPCTGISLNSCDGAFVMTSCSDSVESSAEEGIL